MIEIDVVADGIDSVPRELRVADGYLVRAAEPSTVPSAGAWALIAAWTAVSVSCPLVRIGSRMSHRCRNPSEFTTFVADAGRASDGAGPRGAGALCRGGALGYRSASRAGDNREDQ